MNNKRKTLKKVAGAGAVVALVPSSWTNPVINAVVLPAHAQTSSENDPVVGSWDVARGSFGNSFLDIYGLRADGSGIRRFSLTPNGAPTEEESFSWTFINGILNIVHASGAISSLQLNDNIPSRFSGTYTEPGMPSVDIVFLNRFSLSVSTG